MKKKVLAFLFLLAVVCVFPALFPTRASAMNPFITDYYNAHPSARVFDNRLYVYPSHDRDDQTWFDMVDFHVYSTSDLVTWVDHGIILKIEDVEWAKKWLWGPDCVYKDGKYYLYFCASTDPKSTKDKKGGADDFKIGVAVGNRPAGLFWPCYLIPGTNSVYPNVFIDDDGTAYLYYGGKDHGGLQYPKWAKLKSNMRELATTAQEIRDGIPNWYEGNWVHKRNGIYYLSYATAPYDGAQIEYATSRSPAGPWTYQGVLLSKFTKGTMGHSIVEFPKGSDKWYIFYQTDEMAPNGEKYKRALCVDRLYYNSDGTIRKVERTRTGTGTDAYAKIKAAYYNSMKGVQIEPATGDIGHNLSYLNNGDWTTYEGIVFGSGNSPQTFTASVASPYDGGILEIRLGGTSGGLIGEIDIPNTGGWQNWTKVSCKLNKAINGTQTITLVFRGNGGKDGYLYNLNWFKFIKAGEENVQIPTDMVVSFVSAFTGKYVSTDLNLNKEKPDLVANRDKVGPWEQFEISLVSASQKIVAIRSLTNRKFWNCTGHMNATGGSAAEVDNQFYWLNNGNGKISLKSVKDGYIVRVDSSTKILRVSGGVKPSDKLDEFYVVSHTAPVGCVVAIRSHDYPNNLLISSTLTSGTNYIKVRGNQSGPVSEEFWFQVYDAGDGYIALKSLKHGQFLRVDSNAELKADGGTTIDSNREKFIWVCNSDGSISLKNVQYNTYVCMVMNKPNEVYSEPVYVNRKEIGSWEKFDCIIVR